MAASDPTEIPDGVPGERIDALYGLSPDEFTPRRDALAKELRSAGDRSAADWVKALRKPSAAAWVVNQLARTQRRDAKRLVAAGEQLRRDHERALSGKATQGDLRQAAGKASEAQETLLASATGLLDDRGHAPSEATLERARESLQAVAVDEQARAQFLVGRLTREQRAAGFGLAGAGAPATSSPARTGAGGRDRQKGGAEERSRARDALKEAKARQREASRAVSAAEREVEKARREAERAQRRLEEAGRGLEDARAGEQEAQQRVEDSEAAVERARGRS